MVAHRHTLERRSLSSVARLNRNRRAIDADGFHVNDTNRPGSYTDDRGRGAKSLWRQISLILSIAATSLAAVQLPQQARFAAVESQAFAGATPHASHSASLVDRRWRLSPLKVTPHTGAFQEWEAPYPNTSPWQQSAGLRLAGRK